MTKLNTQINPGRILSVIATVIAIVFLISRHISPSLDDSWAVDKACTEVKSEVYQTYGEIPSLTGSVLYNKDQHYIVLVKYRVSGWDWEASRVCHIYGYGEDNCHLNNMTKELAYDYSYNIEELKALWAIG